MLGYDFEAALDAAYGSAMRHFVNRNSWMPYRFEDVLAVYKKPHGNGKNIIIAEIMINRSSTEIQDYIYDIQNWKHWHKLYKKSKLLVELQNNVKVIYLATKHIGFIRGREFILASKKFEINGYKTVLFTSVEYDCSCLFYKVKAWCHFFYFVINQINEKESCLTLLCHFDPKGVNLSALNSKIIHKFVRNLIGLKATLEKT
ncbi:unnamed protein product [Blepharisma stoltei]|uniref:START domain-containing protein n=1 Tax=Blepharisma stoltei TaxID=1481888 RepID=A0AAU9JPA8_9CILI|nr:unnamed protein product [Blepharisma stoltei]